VHAELDVALEGSRDRAAALGLLRRSVERGRVGAGDHAVHLQLAEAIVGVPAVSSVTVAVTCKWSGGVRRAARIDPRAMVKQAACAAATSSSGLVLPSGSPNRDATVMGRSLMAPLRPEARPEPRAMLPVQLISAVLCTAAIGSSFHELWIERRSVARAVGPVRAVVYAVEDCARAVCCRRGTLGRGLQRH
jgi:hypothetical protein